MHLNFLVQPGLPLGICSTKILKSGARGGMADPLRLLFVWRILLGDQSILSACQHKIHSLQLLPATTAATQHMCQTRLVAQRSAQGTQQRALSFLSQTTRIQLPAYAWAAQGLSHADCYWPSQPKPPKASFGNPASALIRACHTQLPSRLLHDFAFMHTPEGLHLTASFHCMVLSTAFHWHVYVCSIICEGRFLRACYELASAQIVHIT